KERQEWVKDLQIPVVFVPGTDQIKNRNSDESFGLTMQNTTILIVNAREAGQISGIGADDDPVLQLQALRKLGPKVVVITKGEKGAYAVDARGKVMQLGAFNKAIFGPFIDGTGSGDRSSATFIATLRNPKMLSDT